MGLPVALLDPAVPFKRKKDRRMINALIFKNQRISSSSGPFSAKMGLPVVLLDRAVPFKREKDRRIINALILKISAYLQTQVLFPLEWDCWSHYWIQQSHSSGKRTVDWLTILSCFSIVFFLISLTFNSLIIENNFFIYHFSPL